MSENIYKFLKVRSYAYKHNKAVKERIKEESINLKKNSKKESTLIKNDDLEIINERSEIDVDTYDSTVKVKGKKSCHIEGYPTYSQLSDVFSIMLDELVEKDYYGEHLNLPEFTNSDMTILADLWYMRGSQISYNNRMRKSWKIHQLKRVGYIDKILNLLRLKPNSNPYNYNELSELGKRVFNLCTNIIPSELNNAMYKPKSSVIHIPYLCRLMITEGSIFNLRKVMGTIYNNDVLSYLIDKENNFINEELKAIKSYLNTEVIDYSLKLGESISAMKEFNIKAKENRLPKVVKRLTLRDFEYKQNMINMLDKSLKTIREKASYRSDISRQTNLENSYADELMVVIDKINDISDNEIDLIVNKSIYKK